MNAIHHTNLTTSASDMPSRSFLRSSGITCDFSVQWTEHKADTRAFSMDTLRAWYRLSTKLTSLPSTASFETWAVFCVSSRPITKRAWSITVYKVPSFSYWPPAKRRNFGPVCIYVCQTITFESLDVWHIRYVFGGHGQSSYMKVIGLRPRSHEQNCPPVM